MKRELATIIMLLGLALALAAPAPARAEETHRIEPVDVSASAEQERPNSPYRLPESARAATWSIDQAGIEALEPRDVFDVLSYAPGLQTSFQGRKGMNFISGRGGGNFIGGGGYAILVDGVHVPWTQSSRVMASFPVETIESIRVVRDATTLTLAPLSGLGSIGTAIQGVILIKTIKPAKQQSQVKAGVGNLGRYKAFLSHGDRVGDGYYSLNYNKQHDQGRENWNNGGDSDTLLLKGGYDNQNSFKADASFYYDAASRQIQRSTAVSKTSDAKWRYQPLDTLMATASAAKQWTASQTTNLGLYTGLVDGQTEYRSWSKPKAYSEHDWQDNVVQADLSHIIASGANNLRVGGQAIFWHCPNGQLFYEGVSRDEELYSLYLHDEYALSQALSLDAGARVDHKHITKGLNMYSATDAKPSDLIDDVWAEPSYGVAGGAAYQINKMLEATLRLSHTAQGADEFLLTKSGQTLKPEKQLRYELGLVAQPLPALRVTATAFAYDLTDMKQAVGSVTKGDDVINIYDNADAVRSGCELDLGGWLFTPDLTYGLTYGYQRSNNDIDDKSIPHHLATLRLGYRFAPFQGNLLMRYVSDFESNEFAIDNRYHEMDQYSRIDANVSYDFSLDKAQMRATVFAQNLTDERYQTRLGWEDVGLTYGLELAAKF